MFQQVQSLPIAEAMEFVGYVKAKTIPDNKANAGRDIVAMLSFASKTALGNATDYTGTFGASANLTDDEFDAATQFHAALVEHVEGRQTYGAVYQKDHPVLKMIIQYMLTNWTSLLPLIIGV